MEFLEAAKVVLELEGGFNDDPQDTGNWTGGATNKGTLEGTKYGIGAAAHADDVLNLFGKKIKDLTEDEALVIYETFYWQVYDCEHMPSSLALCVFDSAVQNKVLTSELLDQGLTHYALFMAARIQEYTTFRQWSEYGKGWTRRLSRILKEAAKLDVLEKAQELPRQQNGYDDLESLLAGGFKLLREHLEGQTNDTP